MASILRACCLVLLLFACGDSPSAKPDVIVIVVDTLRADRLSAYGYERPTSPFMHRLADEGALFEDVTTQFSWTMPSMVSLFSGRYLTEFMPVVPPGNPTLAECFQAAGYETLAVVSNMLLDPSGGFARGFAHFDVGPSRAGPDPRPRTFEEISEDLWPALDARLAGERKPLFLYLHTFDPHDPYVGHETFDRELPVEAAPGVEPAGWQASELARMGPPPPDGRSDWSAELAFLETERGRYDQEVRYTDEQLRLLMQRLEELGVLEHAVVAIVSDHGEGLWEHVPPLAADVLRDSPPSTFFYHKHGAIQYQEVLDTPMILWGAGVPRGVRAREAVENVDLFPTLLELADVPARGELHGRSLVDVMAGQASSWRQFVFSNSVKYTSVREVSSRLKLLIPKGPARLAGWKLQLYDLGDDPHERIDLAERMPAEVERLAQVHAQWKRRYPTPDYLDAGVREADAARRSEALKALGYTGMDTGLDEGVR